MKMIAIAFSLAVVVATGPAFAGLVSGGTLQAGSTSGLHKAPGAKVIPKAKAGGNGAAQAPINTSRSNIKRH